MRVSEFALNILPWWDPCGLTLKQVRVLTAVSNIRFQYTSSEKLRG